MVERYIMDVGWNDPYSVYNIYGESGGSVDSKATTEALLMACRMDMRQGVFCSTVVLGDFNATPHTLGPVKDWIMEEQWTDLGRRADWWGGIPNRWTCHSRSGAKRSRIDGVLVDAVTLASIHAFEVEENTQIPTHCVLRFQVTRNGQLEKRTFLQKLGSLKTAIEAKWEELTKDKTPKEAVTMRQGEVDKLKTTMDETFQTAAEEFEQAARHRDVDTFWACWS